MNKKRLLQKILMGSQNVRFNDLVGLIEALGFGLERVNGSHHIFKHPDVQEMVNLQDVRGEAKPYQVRQVVELIEAYNLTLNAGGMNGVEEGQE